MAAVISACGAADRGRGEPEPTLIDEADSTFRVADTFFVRGKDTVRTAVRPFVIPDPPDTADTDALRAQQTPAPPDTLPLPPFPDTLAFDALALRIIAQLDPEMTPGEWRASNPADSLDRFVPGSGDVWAWWDRDPWEGDPCVRARRRIYLADGRISVRTVLFNPPQPGQVSNLPVVRDSLGLDLTGCRMGAVWASLPLEVPPWRARADSAWSREDLRAVRSALADRIGSPDSMEPQFVPFGWTGEWRGSAFWRRDGVSTLAVYAPFEGLRAGAWTEASGIEIRPAEDGGSGDLLTLLEIVRTHDLDRGLAHSLLELARQKDQMRAGLVDADGVPDSVLVTRLAAWLEGARGLSASRRAAALFVADRIVAHVLPSVDSSEGSRVAPFVELGAQYPPNEIGGSYDYVGNWLEDAYRLAEAGPVRDRAFLLLLRRSFHRTTCVHEEDAFRTVIERGEAFLSDHPDSPVAPQVALEVARAYGDVVALASETDAVANSYVDGDVYQHEAPRARRASLRHYRRVLSELVEPELSSAVWREGWRLAAGMPPLHTHHVAICD